MPSVALHWNLETGLDMHVLPGETSPSLLNRLVITDDKDKPHLASSPPPDVDPKGIRFEPNFASLVTPPFHSDITVDTKTGEVTVGQNRPPRPRLDRFVIEATVRTKPPSPRTLGPIPIRVHVPDSIDDMWLTPSPLTVRDLTSGSRFTVLARFDDNTVGDITGRPGFQWTHSDPANPTDPAVRVHPTTGALAGSGSSGTVTITAKHVGRTATGIALARPKWAQPIEAVLLTSRSAGIHKMAVVPNVLFLSEGFDQTEKIAYEEMVRKIVDMIQDPSTKLRPFDLLKGAVNYWMAFVPSREAGVSALYDLNPVVGPTVRGEEIPLPVRPPATLPAGTNLTLEQLIYAVGLPTPADRTATLQTKLLNWLVQFGPSVATNVDQAVFARWQALHDHRLANEVDSAFGVAMGSRPKLDRPHQHRAPDLSLRRSRPENLDQLLSTMFCQTTNHAPVIGTIWATPDPDPNNPDPNKPDPADPGLPTGLKRGQDRGLVFFLLRGARYGGNKADYAIFGSLVENVEVLLAPVGSTGRLAVVPHPLPPTPALATVARVAHETAHGFKLKDEYGDPSRATELPDAEKPKLTLIGNVQPASDLAVSATDPRLDPAKVSDIKWTWPRIAAAGVLTGQPTPAAGGTFRIDLRRGQAAGFGKDDIVRLRRKDLLPSTPASVRLRVTAKPDLANDRVTVRVLDPATGITPADWPAGSLLIRPVRGKAIGVDPFGPDLLLVASVVLDHLKAARVPLNRAPPATGAPVCVRNDASVLTPSRVMQVPGNPSVTLRGPKFRQHIVGLYDAGATYYCGIYHPTGQCLMRAQTSSGTPPQVYPFCWVCAYFIVDRFDPTKHSVVEKDFGKQYPRV